MGKKTMTAKDLNHSGQGNVISGGDNHIGCTYNNAVSRVRPAVLYFFLGAILASLVVGVFYRSNIQASLNEGQLKKCIVLQQKGSYYTASPYDSAYEQEKNNHDIYLYCTNKLLLNSVFKNIK